MNAPENVALRILLVEDSALDAELTIDRLKAAGYDCRVTIVDNAEDFMVQLANDGFDIVLADFSLPAFSGTEALALARSLSSDLPFIFVSGVLGEEHAVDMLKNGATDYVLKQRLQRLPAVVHRALTEREERRQRILAERQLRETETHFRQVVDALKDYAVMTLDTAGCVRTWNGAAHQILGYAADEVTGLCVDILFTPEDKAEGTPAAELAEARAAGSASDDRWLVHKQGHRLFASGVTTAIRDDQGELTGYSKIIRDTTQQRNAAEALGRAKEQAETANRAKDHFLAVLSHELRTPLTPILAAVRFMQITQGLSADAKRSLDVIRRNVELEARLIDDLLDVTSIARGKLTLTMHPVELTALIESAIEMSSSDIEAKALALSVGRRASATTVHGDTARLQQILWNIIKNAVKFTPENGSIHIEMWNPDAAQVCIAVKDTGIGISASALPKIFSAFEQADVSIGPAFGGLGLGLAIVHTLVQKHGGSITAQSDGKGQGATFTVTLPVMATVAERDVQGAGDAPVPRALRGLRIMLVEDNAFTATAMAQLLEALGHEVMAAASVAKATAMMRDRAFDVLVSDIGLPDGTGLDVIEAWKRHQSGMPAIAITGYGMDDDVRRCHAAGFASHLTKPIDFDQLERFLGDLAERRPGPH